MNLLNDDRLIQSNSSGQRWENLKRRLGDYE